MGVAERVDGQVVPTGTLKRLAAAPAVSGVSGAGCSG